jgi:hypothetical protein
MKWNLDSLANRLRELSEQEKPPESDDPVLWLERNTGFRAWQYEADIIRNHAKRLRVIRKSRQIGISTTIAYESLWKACTIPNRLILIVSPSDRQSRLIMDKIQTAIQSKPELRGLVVRQNLSELVLGNGSQIVSLPNNPDRIRGYAAHDVILDEAAHFERQSSVMPVVSPMISATGGTLTIISTPFTKRNLFWDWYKEAMDSQASDSTVQAFDLYPSTISPLISEGELERRKRGMLEAEFRQEFLGEFIEELDSFLPMQLLQGCIHANLDVESDFQTNPNLIYVMGVDFAKKRDQTVAIILEVDVERRRIRVKHVWAISGMDYAAQIAHLHELALKFGVQYVLADQTGVGEAVIEQLKAAVPGSEGLIFTVASKLDIANGLKFVLEQKRIDLPDHRTLLMQLNGLSTVVHGDRIIFDTDEREHDDHAWSLMLAVKAANRYIPAADDENKVSVIFGEPFEPLHSVMGIGDVRLF